MPLDRVTQLLGHESVDTTRIHTTPSELFVDALRIPYIGPSFGGTEALVEQVALSSYYELSSEERAAMGISGALVRLAVGVENADDLIADLAQALDRAFGDERQPA